MVYQKRKHWLKIPRILEQMSSGIRMFVLPETHGITSHPQGIRLFRAHVCLSVSDVTTEPFF